MDEEIDLREIVDVIIKRRNIMLYVTAAFVILSVIFAVTRPPVYQSTALIQPALIDKKPVESAESISVLLKNPDNPYLKDIAQQIGVPERSVQGISSRFDIEDKAAYLLINGRADSPHKAKQLAELVCSLIMARQDEIVKDAIRISSGEITSVNQQMDYGKKDIEQLDKDISQKEKTTVLAQSYVFQALIQAKESKLVRQAELMDKLSTKEMEIRYFTIPAETVAAAALPQRKIGPNRTKIVLLFSLAGLALSVLLAFGFEYFEKRPLLLPEEKK